MTEALFEVGLDATDFAEGIRDAVESSDAFEVRLDLISKKLTQSMHRFFAFVKEGTGETAKQLETLEARFDSLEQKISTAAGERGAVKGFVGILGGIADESTRGTIAIDTLGASIGMLVTPMGPVVDLAERLADALSRISPSIGTPRAAGPGIGRAAASERARVAALGDIPDLPVLMPELVVEGGRPRGGSGGARRAGSLEATLERATVMGEAAEEEERRTADHWRRLEDMQRTSLERRLNQEKDALERSQAILAERAEVEENAYQRRIELEMSFVASQKRREDEQKRLGAAEVQAARANASALIDITGGLMQTIAGDHAGANWIKAGTEALDAILSIPNWIEVARHGANAAAAVYVASQDDSRAGSKRSGGPISVPGFGGGSGGVGGGGFAPGAAGGGGSAPSSIVINVPGAFVTERALQAALVGAIGSAADFGYQIPGRAVPERRR